MDDAGGWGWGEADDLVVVFVVVLGLRLHLDLGLHLVVADVFIAIVFVLAFAFLAGFRGEAWPGLGLPGPDSPPLLGLPRVKARHVSGLLGYNSLTRRGTNIPPLLLPLLPHLTLTGLPLGLGCGLG